MISLYTIPAQKVRVWSRYGKKLVFVDAKFILRGITQEQQQNYFYDYQKPMDESNIMLIFRNGQYRLFTQGIYWAFNSLRQSDTNMRR